MNSKNRNVIAATLIIISAALAVVSIASCIRLKNVVVQSSSSVSALQSVIAGNMRSGYRAITDIDAGAMISDSMVEYSSTIVSDVDASQFISEDDIGKVATVKIAAGTPVLKDMVSAQLAADYHERECSFIWLNTNLKDNDFVDVRIMFPNGEDDIVAAKKSVKEVAVEANNMFLWLTEDENDLLSAAIVDANLHGARIYVTKYLKPEIQEASTVTYTPNSSVLAAIKDNPNIVDQSAANLSASAREAMENRIELFEKAYPDYEFNTKVGSSDAIISDSAAQAAEDTVDDTGDTSSSSSSDSTEASSESEVEYVD